MYFEKVIKSLNTHLMINQSSENSVNLYGIL